MSLENTNKNFFQPVHQSDFWELQVCYPFLYNDFDCGHPSSQCACGIQYTIQTQTKVKEKQFVCIHAGEILYYL